MNVLKVFWRVTTVNLLDLVINANYVIIYPM